MPGLCVSCVVSQLETELEQLMLHLVFTQGVSTALLSNIKTLKNATRKAGTDKSHAEDQKLKQVDDFFFFLCVCVTSQTPAEAAALL